MITILLMAATLVIACVVFHGFSLQWIAQRLFRRQNFSFYRISLLIAFAILAHLFEIVLFELAYLWLINIEGIGGIIGDGELSPQDLFYFSAVTYTSTGYGDMVPVGRLRLLATIEALTGLIMIAWTASFAFLVMQRYWKEHDKSDQ